MTCKTCKNICEKAGRNMDVCKKYSSIKAAKIKTKTFYSFPEKIIVESRTSGRQIVFVPES